MTLGSCSANVQVLRCFCMSSARNSWLAVVLSLSCLAAMWLFTDRFFTRRIAPQYEIPGRGYPSDLLPPWVATQHLLHGNNPYGSEATGEIQRRYYGPGVGVGNTSSDQQRFAYPVYTTLLLLPFQQLEFHAVANAARVLLPLLIAGAVLLWTRLFRIASRAETAATVFFALASWPVAQGEALQQLGLLAFFFIVCSVYFAASRAYIVAGIILALATMKPQAVLPLFGWFAVWSVADIRARWKLPFSFVVATLLLVVIGEWQSPGWIVEWAGTVGAYRSYAATGSLLEGLFGIVGLLVDLIIVIWAGLAMWKRRAVSSDSPDFLRIAAMAMAVGLLVSPVWVSHNQVMLLPAAIVIWFERKCLMRSVEGIWLFFAALALQCSTWIYAGLVLLSVLPPPTGRLIGLYPATISLPLLAAALIGLLVRKQSIDSEAQFPKYSDTASGRRSKVPRPIPARSQ